MSRTCNVCTHDARAAIDKALVRSGDSFRDIAGHYGLSKSSVERHAKEHLARRLLKAREAAEVAQADDLLEEVCGLQARTLAILEAAEETGELRTALAAIREARSNLELLAELLGELDERPQVNVLIAGEVRTAIVEALTPYGEARLAVANALEPFEEARAR